MAPPSAGRLFRPARAPASQLFEQARFALGGDACFERYAAVPLPIPSPRVENGFVQRTELKSRRERACHGNRIPTAGLGFGYPKRHLGPRLDSLPDQEVLRRPD